MSFIDATLSDGLCRLATGSGFAVRALHTDKDENIFDGARPIVVNGIPALAERADLNERSIIARLAAIPEDKRLPEDEMELQWEIARPRVLGALYDAVSAALRHVAAVRLPRAGRMADFEKWLTAAEPGLGRDPGTFSAAYGQSRRDSVDAAFESDPVAVAINELMVKELLTMWHGTATGLLGRLSDYATDQVRTLRIWPKTATGPWELPGAVSTAVAHQGDHHRRRKSGERMISIVRKIDA